MFTSSAYPAQARLAYGRTWHQREQPAANSFSYGLIFLLLPMRALRQLSDTQKILPHNRAGLFSFWDCDHGVGESNALAWVEKILAENGEPNFQGEIWLQTLPRMLGYAFKPVSYWFAIRLNGELAAVLVEVNNTFGERHCYLLNSTDLAWGIEVVASKVFHVSPFFSNRGEYKFRFNQQGETIASTINLTSSDGKKLLTSWTGKTQAITASALRKALLAAPLMTFMIVVKIHWQAIKLFYKRVPFFRQPAPPTDFISK